MPGVFVIPAQHWCPPPSFCALVVCHHRVRFLFYPSSTSFLKQNQREQELSRRCRGNRKPFIISATAPSDVHWIQSDKKKCCARIIAAISVSFTKVQDFSKSLELLAGKYILPSAHLSENCDHFVTSPALSIAKRSIASICGFIRSLSLCVSLDGLL
jgi:hypothetical protein